jgi:hypothetical protein
MAVAREKEHSVLASLSELRAIEEERVRDERDALRAAELARIAATEADARAREEAIAKKARDEHEAKLAIENARFVAEREARMKIEAAEAQERARQAAMLAEARLAQEMELRRAEVARKRPTWMLVVTAIASVAAFVLIYVAIERTRAQEQAETERKIAVQKQVEMRTQLDQLQTTVAGIQTELAELDKLTDKLVEQLKAADTAAKVADAQRELQRIAERRRQLRINEEKLQKEKDDLERKGGVHMSDKCKKNALC